MSSLSKSSSLSSSSASETFSVVCVTSCGERLPFVTLSRGPAEDEGPPRMELPETVPAPRPLPAEVLGSSPDAFALATAVLMLFAFPAPPTLLLLLTVPKCTAPGVLVGGPTVAALEGEQEALDEEQGDARSRPSIDCCCCCCMEE